MLKSWIKTADFCPQSLRTLSDKAFYKALSDLPKSQLCDLEQKAQAEAKARLRFKTEVLPFASEDLKTRFPHAFRTAAGRKAFILRMNGLKTNPEGFGFGNAPPRYHKAKGGKTPEPRAPRGFWGRDY